jgi:hypothetical protein
LKARPIDGIYLRFLNTQGGHEIMNLSTGQIIRRRQVSIVPMTTHVIECVHRMANCEKIPDRLRVMSKAGVILHDNAWLPGVIYSTTNEDKEEEMEEEFHVNEDDKDEADESDIYEIMNVSNVKEKDKLNQDYKNDNEGGNEKK